MRNTLHRITRLSTLAVACALVALVAGGLTPAVTHAQDGGQTPRTITVVGNGSASGSPDVAYIQVGVEIHDADISAAISSANETMQAVIDALQDAGIAPEDIQTTNFNVYQEDSRDPESGQPTGETTYVVSNTARVKVNDLEQISAVIQTALDAGANRVFGLNFGLDDPDALIEEARQEAVQDAQTRAQALADAFGVSITAVPLRISEGRTAEPLAPQTLAMESARGGGGPVISEGQLSVNYQVTVVYELAS